MNLGVLWEKGAAGLFAGLSISIFNESFLVVLCRVLSMQGTATGKQTMSS
jgi:hypothetical protein